MTTSSEAGSEATVPGPSAAEVVVDPAAASRAKGANPFPGPRPFAERDSSLFFGRERELSDLVALLFAQRAVLLHAPSGAGKSSLVNAGLIPRARQRGFEFLPVARVRGITPGSDDPTGNRYIANVIENWRAAGLDLPPQAADLREVLSRLPQGGEPGLVVIFDQFEELFVLHPDRWRDRGDLFTQIQAALDRDPLLHFLFVLRDDYLAQLQPLTPRLRDRLNTRYHLGGLSPAQALDAVVRPFAASGRIFMPGVGEAFVTALREQPAEFPANGRYVGEDVEPVQLQIVCRTFFERLPGDVTEIGAEDVARHADVQQALVGFYEQAIAAVVKGHAGVRERRVRLWFERQLITPARTRGIVFRDERTTAGLANQVVDELEQRRLVRSEPRGPALWYELTHDRLIDAVLGSNRLWYAKRSRLVTRRAGVAVALCLLLVTAAVSVALHSRHGGASASGVAAPKESQISTPGQTIEFTAHGRAGQLLTATLDPGDKFLGELQLFDPKGVAVGSPSSAQSSRPLISTTLDHGDGDYRVEARGRNGSTGSFKMTLAVQTVRVARDPLAGPGPIPGSITAPDQVDIYTFDGRAGALAKITMVSSNYRSHLLMIGPGGQGFDEVPSINDGALASVLPSDGRYEVHAWSADKSPGLYQIQLQIETGSSVQPGDIAWSASAEDPTDVRTVRSDAGGVLTVAYRPGTGSVNNALLLAANGDTLVQDYGAGRFIWVIAPELTYLLVINGHNTGPSDLKSISLTIDQPLPLTDGHAQGQLVRTGQRQVFRLDSGPGDIASVVVTPIDRFDPRVVVIQPDGTTLVDQNSDGAGQPEKLLLAFKQVGPHLIVISSSDTRSTGGYRIVFTVRKSP